MPTSVYNQEESSDKTKDIDEFTIPFVTSSIIV